MSVLLLVAVYVRRVASGSLTMRSPLLRRVHFLFARARGQWSSRLGPTNSRMMTSKQQLNPSAGRAFDITPTKQVAREIRGGARRKKHDAAAWHLSGAFTRFDRRVSTSILKRFNVVCWVDLIGEFAKIITE